MNTRYPQLASATGPRVDGIDVAELLRTLGEASAASSAVDLFGLCLNAQRVLARAHVSVINTSSDETTLLAAFRLMDDSARSDMLLMMQGIAERFPRRPPLALTLVQHDQNRYGGAQ